MNSSNKPLTAAEIFYLAILCLGMAIVLFALMGGDLVHILCDAIRWLGWV